VSLRRPDVGLVRTGFIAIPAGVRHRFDHADVSRSGRRIYVASTGAEPIERLDCETRRYLRALRARLLGVPGVLIDEEHDLLFSSRCRHHPNMNEGASDESIRDCHRLSL